MVRQVTEDFSNKKAISQSDLQMQSSTENDIQLQTIDAQMRNLSAEFDKTHDQLAEIFCKVSGRVSKVRDFLTLERQFIQRQQKVAGGLSQMSQKSMITSNLNTSLPRALLSDNSIAVWSHLEDLALKKPEDTAEFQVLLQTKGLDEIETRR